MKALILLLSLVSSSAFADELPTELGTCSYSYISNITFRLGDDDPSSGSTVEFDNGGMQTGYDYVEAVHRSNIGDEVQICLVSQPEDCPPGDDRGKVYTTTNLSTQESWTMPDSSHSCGGA